MLQPTPRSTLDGGSHCIFPNSLKTIAVVVSGGDQVVGLDFVVQIGDGGPVNGGTDQGPTIVSGDITGPGTIFYAKNAGDQPMSAGNMIWTDSTLIDPVYGPSLAAQGTVAYLTIDTTGLSAGSSYPLRLQDVAAKIFGGAGVNTDFVNVIPTILDGTIYVTNCHSETWNVNANGNWTDPSWSGIPAVSPDYTADAVINKPYTVTVAGAAGSQHADARQQCDPHDRQQSGESAKLLDRLWQHDVCRRLAVGG